MRYQTVESVEGGETKDKAQRPYLRIFVGIFSKCTKNDGNFGQARPMKHKFCRDFVGTNAGYWRKRPP